MFWGRGGRVWVVRHVAMVVGGQAGGAWCRRGWVALSSCAASCACAWNFATLRPRVRCLNACGGGVGERTGKDEDVGAAVLADADAPPAAALADGVAGAGGLVGGGHELVPNFSMRNTNERVCCC